MSNEHSVTEQAAKKDTDNQALSRRRFIQNSASTLLVAGAGLPAALPVAAAPSDEEKAGCAVPTASADEMLQRYRRADAIERGTHDHPVAFNTTLFPHWISGHSFWYRHESPSAKRYLLVDVASGSKTEAFDHRALASALASSTGKSVDLDQLPISDVDISLSPRQVGFAAFAKHWRFDGNRCQEMDVTPKDWEVSPDGKKAVFRRDYNLWLRDLQTGKERALTTDGEKFNVYANAPTVNGRQETPTFQAIWSPDSKRVFSYTIDTREVKVGPPLVRHVPLDGSLRPTIHRPDRRIAWPDDEIIEAYRFVAIDVDSGTLTPSSYRPSPVFYPPYRGFFSGLRGWWNRDSRRAYYIDLERGGKVGRLIEFDTHTGKTRVLIEDKPEHTFSFIPVTHLSTLLMPMPDSNELIWYSEVSGRAHLYLYDLDDGRLKNPITQGDWLVRNVLHLDTEKRELLIQTADRINGRNPYYCDICRVKIDSGELAPLLSTDHEYVVCDQRSRISARDNSANGVSADGGYIVTTRSRVDQVPVTLVVDRNGRHVMDVETADLSGLPENWHWPEPILVKAADGKTDLHAVVFRPTDFDPDKIYPVIDCSYGYASPVGSFSNSPLGSYLYLPAAAIAELGFISVVILNRGNNGLRDAAFRAHQDPRLPLNPLTTVKHHKGDCVAGIKQLCERYPYMDVTRVGILGLGSIALAESGMLMYPEFYKVGVGHNPKCDQRLMPAQASEGVDFPQLEDYAGNLRGKLMIMSGMLDDVNPVTMTFRLVDALQRANKSFDMILLPNQGHGATAYNVRRTWDYFVQHLLGEEPPENFQPTFKTGMDRQIDAARKNKSSD